MRMKLVRDNDDPKLLADLERLAGREPVVPVEPEVDAADAGPVGEPGTVEPLDDPFVRRFVQVSVHLKRYLPFYAGAAVWALTMLLIQPLGKGGGSDVANGGPGFAGQAVPAAATASAGTAVTDLSADAVAAPTFETVTGATFGDTSISASDLSGSSDTEFAGSDSFSGSDSSSSSDLSSTSTTITFDDSAFGSDDAKQLTITRSGYGSITGGTPAEQAPANGGLPVAATAGQDSKRSFIALDGEGSQLRLKVSTDGALQPETAVVKLCKLTGEWKADRGQQLNSTPGYDPACSTGSVLDGVWTFDLSSFSAADRAAGLTLTPGAGTGLTFQVVFEPTPLPNESA
jgi:hypothetical protein